MKNNDLYLICPDCNEIYDLSKPRWRCNCGNYLLLKANISFSINSINNTYANFYRYKQTLPFLNEEISIGEGITPLTNVKINNRECELKLDYLLPTGSYKDRGVAVMISMLKQWGLKKIVEDSSGNAGSAVAAYSSKAKINCDVYIPDYTSLGKAAQIELYGANLIKVKGTREDTAQAAYEAGIKDFYASHNWSPFFEHGVKTYIYEIWEQKNYKLPDYIIVPCGNGSLVTSAYIASKELYENKLIKKIPKIIAVQSENCQPLAKAFFNNLNEPIKIEKTSTLAEGISSATPLKGKEVLKAVYDSKGMFITVSDQEIWASLKELAKKGIFIEPTSATAVAAYSKLVDKGYFSSDESVVIQLTGHGLKAVDKVLQLMGKE
jgi:threonine synthase